MRGNPLLRLTPCARLDQGPPCQSRCGAGHLAQRPTPFISCRHGGCGVLLYTSGSGRLTAVTSCLLLKFQQTLVTRLGPSSSLMTEPGCFKLSPSRSLAVLPSNYSPRGPASSSAGEKSVSAETSLTASNFLMAK